MTEERKMWLKYRAHELMLDALGLGIILGGAGLFMLAAHIVQGE